MHGNFIATNTIQVVQFSQSQHKSSAANDEEIQLSTSPLTVTHHVHNNTVTIDTLFAGIVAAVKQVISHDMDHGYNVTDHVGPQNLENLLKSQRHTKLIS